MLGSLVWAVGKDQRIYASDYCWTTNGMQRTSAELNTMISAIGDTRMWAVIDGEFSITNDVTFNANTLLEYTHKTGFDVDSGVTLTINGPIFNPFTNDVYSGSGTVVLSDTGPVMEILNGGTSGTTGQIARAGNDVTITFPEGGGLSTNLITLTNALAHVYVSTNWEALASTITKVPFDTEVVDTKGYYDLAGNNRFDVSNNAYYVFNAHIGGSSDTANGILLYRNGTNYVSTSNAEDDNPLMFGPVWATNGDYFELYYETTGGATRTNAGGFATNWFQISEWNEFEIYGSGGSGTATGGPAIDHEFHVYINVPETNPPSTGQKVNWDTVVYDVSSAYSISNARYVAPEDGIYAFFTASDSGESAGGVYGQNLYKNGTLLFEHREYAQSQGARDASYPLVNANSGDYFEIYHDNQSVFGMTNAFGATNNWFFGYMLESEVGGGTVSSTNVMFSVFSSTNFVIAAGATVKYIPDTEDFDYGNDFDLATTKRFVAPSDGVYTFFTSKENTTAGPVTLILYKNGSPLKRGRSSSSFDSTAKDTFGLINLAAGDYIEVYLENLNAASSTIVGSSTNNWLTGYKIE